MRWQSTPYIKTKYFLSYLVKIGIINGDERVKILTALIQKGENVYCGRI